MICKVRNTVAKYNMIPQGSKVLVALSGGADSMSLLYSLIMLREELEIDICAAHVNHSIRGEDSDADEQYVRSVCNKLGIELYCVKYDVPAISKQTGEGLEECGRRLRYEFFESICESALIATAHNLNDCEETLLFNLTRGAGLNGLCSIPPIRGNIIRPLIECSRDEIEQFCFENSIDYVIDKTNCDVSYSRNRIRHNVIPQLKEINSSFDSSALRCINLLRDDNSFLELCAENLVNECYTEFGYDVSIILNSHSSVRRRALLKIVENKIGEKSDYQTIERIEDILNGGLLQITTDVYVRVRKGLLDFTDLKNADDFIFTLSNGLNEFDDFSVNYDILNNSVIQKQNGCNNNELVYLLDYDKVFGTVVIRNRREGDRFYPAGRSCTKTLKKLFNESGIVPEKRSRVLLCSDEKGILLVEGFGVDQRCALSSTTKNILKITVRRSE